MTKIERLVIEWPLNTHTYALTMVDNEMTCWALIASGNNNDMRQRMREVSELLVVLGDPVETDMSFAVAGYPQINHSKCWLQVITWDEWLEGKADPFCGHLTATGAHLGSTG
jgi:hypothetical protein